MSSASGPRASPTMIRSGRIRRALIIRSRDVTEPWPSMFDSRVSSLTICVCCSMSSAMSSIVTTRSVSGTKRESAFSSVVLPLPLPPEITMLRRARTHPPSSSSIGAVNVWLASNSSLLRTRPPKRRIESEGPSSVTGGMAAVTREPSARRAATIGLASSMRRPAAATIFSMMCSRCLSSLN